jgi:MFS superfamily sulfate permease-like transporter
MLLNGSYMAMCVALLFLLVHNARSQDLVRY